MRLSGACRESGIELDSSIRQHSLLYILFRGGGMSWSDQPYVSVTHASLRPLEIRAQQSSFICGREYDGSW